MTRRPNATAGPTAPTRKAEPESSAYATCCGREASRQDRAASRQDRRAAQADRQDADRDRQTARADRDQAVIESEEQDPGRA
jgi:hypothetical protein